MQMADFGFVKKVLPGQRTSTLCGTPEYLAPELITGEGHWQAADWWVVVNAPRHCADAALMTLGRLSCSPQAPNAKDTPALTGGLLVYWRMNWWQACHHSW